MVVITVSDISAEVEWKKIKNVHLTVYPPNGRIHVSAPIEMPEDAVRLFLITKIPWIQQRIIHILEQERQTKREFVSGENHYFKGHRFRLKVMYCDAPPKVTLKGNTSIILCVRPDSPSEKRAEIMREWYRSQLKTLLQPIISKWEKIIGVNVAKWEVKQMKTLWGSCNHHTGNILFNLELAKKPLSCIEYIVVHELLHLKFRLHNQAFTSKMSSLLPNWRYLKDQLNEFIV